MIQLPSGVASILRPLLQAEGAPADVINADNSLDPVLFLSTFYDTVRVESNVTPTITIPIAAASGPQGPTLGLLAPKFTFSGRAGIQTVALRGEPIPGLGWLVPLVLLGTLFAAGYAVGKRVR